jgi:hypothetical protein
VRAEERLANDPTSELWGEHRARYRFAAQFIGGDVLLDVACGSGFGLQMLADGGGAPIGLDYDAAALRAIRCAQPESKLRDLLLQHFSSVRLFGQRPSRAYRYVPFLMLQPEHDLSALVWKTLVRLPFGVKNRVALAVSGRPFYPGEDDYEFDEEATHNAHALVAVAR